MDEGADVLKEAFQEVVEKFAEFSDDALKSMIADIEQKVEEKLGEQNFRVLSEMRGKISY